MIFLIYCLNCMQTACEASLGLVLIVIGLIVIYKILKKQPADEGYGSYASGGRVRYK